MTDGTALERLASLHGIALDYHDIWGHRHQVPGRSLAALLSAMGVKAGTPAEADAAVAAAERARWSSVLDPVHVVRAGASPWPVRLSLPARLDASELAWQLEQEGGGRAGGVFVPRDLPLLEEASVSGERYAARELRLAAGLPNGYHRLSILDAERTLGEARFVVAPATCYRPPALEAGGRLWGFTAQLYSVRSERNWGIGDFTDLRGIVDQWGARGADLIGVNPLHALFPHNPAHASPYSPSSRLFKNVLFLDVEAIEDFRECEPARAHVRSAAFQSRLIALRETPYVDYAGVAQAKLEVLEMLFAHFRDRHLVPARARGAAFRAFQAAGGENLRRHALFEALQERFHREDASVWGWPVWPEAFRDPASPAVGAFAREGVERVEFYEWLQWQADLQLGKVGRRAFELGLGVGLYEDLAVSIDRAGAEAWGNQALYALVASVGAPPDDFNLKGQNWGLPPLVPERLRASAYEPFVDTLRANMRHAGALRIDHVMGLMRLFWVPPGGEPADGAYVHYPFADLLGILALESERNRCMVIGEDLGTVPDEVRHALGEAGVLSYGLLYFQRDPAGNFKRPEDYPAQTLVAVSTHDLPTLAGWWEGADLTLRDELGLFPSREARQAQVVDRAQDRARLLLALEREQLLPDAASVNPVSLPEVSTGFARSVHAFVAASPCQVMVAQLEDLLGMREQMNLPGTVDEHPNWRRKLPVDLERLPEHERMLDIVAALARLRGRPRAAQARAVRRETVIPGATYRLQLHRDFTFAAATALVPYLARLGVSHVYCSPYLRARPGSRHGYDIIDHAALNPEIGNRDDFERFVEALRAHGMGQILDVVPNHMGIMGADNLWWMDVLENGPASAYAGFFDIDWAPIDPALAGRVLVPVLGDHYGQVLERGELRLVFEPQGGAFAVRYYEHRFPIDPREYPRILERVAKLLAPGALAEDAAADLASLSAAFGHLPPREATQPEAVAERGRDKEVLKARLARRVREHPPLAEAIERALHALNGSAGERSSFDALEALLDAQAYRLAYWRVAADEINYRRFFDINDLAALRMEDPVVFEATHRFVLELVAEGKVDGLRIDHPDGLHDPEQYVRRVQERCAQLAASQPEGAGWQGEERRPVYLVLEKITASHERLPESWPVHGTTGYRFANVVNGLFVDDAAKSRVDRIWRAFVREEAVDFEEAAYVGRKAIMRSALAGELTVLARALLRIARADRRTRDFTVNTLRDALAEVVACFPVYRTYIAERASAQDRRFIEWAVGRARRRGRASDASIFEFLREVLLVRPRRGSPAAQTELFRRFAMRFQQFTAPVAAKGVEDTAFYLFNRLVSLNEVGGDPDQFGIRVSGFHGASLDRAAHWPCTMLATSTHDNKRSEDVRARIDLISEMPAAWRLLVRRWSRLNRSKKRTVEGDAAPSRNDEYLLYQTLVGTFPPEGCTGPALQAYGERIAGYMVKAVREAKRNSSWVNVNEPYEAAVTGFVRALLDGREGNLFLQDLAVQAAAFGWFGMLNSLSMTLIKCTSPGVPDVYQGEELIDLALVDPDNRRPVDYALRAGLLDEMEALATVPAGELAQAVGRMFDPPYPGRAKLWVLWRALALRRARPELFREGEYQPVAVTGAAAEHVVAYARRRGDHGVVVVAGRLFAKLGLAAGRLPLGEQAWGDTALDLRFLPQGTRLVDALSGAETAALDGALRLAQALARFPGALLVYGPEPEAGTR